MSSRTPAQSGKIAVVGERELVIGYRLLGVQDAFIARKGETQKTVMDLFNSGDYSLIVVGDEARKDLSTTTKEKLRSSIIPLVVFMPSLTADVSEESIASLARRILRVDLKVSA